MSKIINLKKISYVQRYKKVIKKRLKFWLYLVAKVKSIWQTSHFRSNSNSTINQCKKLLEAQFGDFFWSWYSFSEEISGGTASSWAPNFYYVLVQNRTGLPTKIGHQI